MLDVGLLTEAMMQGLFQSALATPRRSVLFRGRTGMRLEATFARSWFRIFVLAGQFDDDIAEADSGEDWVRKALEGAGIEYSACHAADGFEDRWLLYETHESRYLSDGSFWAAALAALHRARAMGACGTCGEALTADPLCPACWAAAVAAPAPSASASTAPKDDPPGAPNPRRTRRRIQ